VENTPAVPPERPEASTAAGDGTTAGPRASDAERERFVSLLQRHFAEGRLSGPEFSDRLDRALAARTLSELYALCADLPDPPAVDTPPALGGRRRRSLRFWRP